MIIIGKGPPVITGNTGYPQATRRSSPAPGTSPRPVTRAERTVKPLFKLPCVLRGEDVAPVALIHLAEQILVIQDLRVGELVPPAERHRVSAVNMQRATSLNVCAVLVADDSDGQPVLQRLAFKRVIDALYAALRCGAVFHGVASFGCFSELTGVPRPWA